MSNKRKVNLEKLDEEQINAICLQLGEKITQTLEKPLETVQNILEIYGLEIEFSYNIKKKESDINS